MARTVFGTISSQIDGSPVAGALVEAWDSDIGGDDFMGCAITDQSGNYSIQYAGGHWDPAPHGIITWRPDIYIRIHMQNNSEQWVRVHESSVHSDQKLREDLRIDAQVSPPNPYARTVWGYLSWRDSNQPAVDVLVMAWDADWGFTGGEAGRTDNGYQATGEFGPSAEFMGSTHTNQQGLYKIPYVRGHWDASPFQRWTWWRPDIYITVTANDDQGNTHTLYKSPVHSNIPHRDGVRIDGKIKSVIEAVEAYRVELLAENTIKEDLSEGKLTIEEARKVLNQHRVARVIKKRPA